MDVGKAFGYVFEDERWTTKLLIGAGIVLIPIFGTFALAGYVISTIRNVMAGHPRPLPEWQDLGGNFVDGLKMVAVNLVYALPVILVSWAVLLPTFLPLLGGQNEDVVAVLGIVAMVLMILIGCLMLVYWLFLLVVGPMAQIVYATRGEIGAALRFGKVLRLAFANIGQILIAQLLVFVASFTVSGVLGLVLTALSLIPICGWILMVPATLLALPLTTWLMLFMAHLYGQIGARAGLSPSV